MLFVEGGSEGWGQGCLLTTLDASTRYTHETAEAMRYTFPLKYFLLMTFVLFGA